MNKTYAALALTLSAFGLPFALTGCGGGGGGSSAPAPAAASFTPNYVASITPYHWPALPVRVYFANDLTITPKGGTATRLNMLFQSGFDRWPAATNGVVSYQVVTDPALAQITVSAVTVPDPQGQAETGITTVAHTGSVLTAAAMQIFVWPDITPTELTQGQLATATHEFGHALGVGGHSPVATDEMFALHDPNQDVLLSPRDVNTIKTIYAPLFPAP